MKHRDVMLGIFFRWKKIIETQTSRKIKKLRSNNGGEYKNDLFLKIYQDEGIIQHFINIDSPQQHGVAECMNQTLLEKIKCILLMLG